MSPEEAIKQLDQILRGKYSDITILPSGICSRTIQIPFKSGSALQYTLTLFVEVEMAPTTGVATAIRISHPPGHSWESTPEEMNSATGNLRTLFDMITDLGKEYLTRERQTLKVLNNQELGKQLSRLCQANGGDGAADDADEFVIRKGQAQVTVKIIEDKTASPHAAINMTVNGIDSKDLLSAVKVLLQNAAS
ncbi:hypothetical protein DV711_08690 [Motiliproteus coralliicola]|uniref:Uncharacterized protein n=1 Tax=Motiliproteus coralliicola TaxID=2283196 RepID=A0A369WKR1_9GAMM|nr:hypothetical protein [Motiliproteus coralliicola]RDE22650.1 hypothetical protein DV711_08690 [Motiliproteus coralliicola]